MRQLGYEQKIPTACDTSTTFHGIDQWLNNKSYPLKHQPYIEKWSQRESRVVQGTPIHLGVILMGWTSIWHGIVASRGCASLIS